MKKTIRLFTAVFLCLTLFAGCASGNPAPTTESTAAPATKPTAAPTAAPATKPTAMPTTEAASAPTTAPEQTSKLDTIPFEEGQLFAVAYLGYQQIDDLEYYVQRYLDSDELETYTISEGDYYLIIPRYPDMTVSLYAADMETSENSLCFETASCDPFIIQCNISDIFSDAILRFTYNGNTVEYSPFISLEDGSLQTGDYGLEITKEAES